MDVLRAGLVAVGLTEVLFACRNEVPLAEDREKRYGNIVASRWSLTPVAVTQARWPQLLVITDVASDLGPIRAMNAHIPNESGSPVPVILAGDFNEPLSFQPAFHSFGAKAPGRVDG